MSFRCFLFALALAIALPSTAQQTCNLQMTVTCTAGSSSQCTATTLNAGSNACTGQYLTGFYIAGAGSVGGFSNSLGLGQCVDSSLFPQPGFAYSFCLGPSVLHPNGSFTSSATVSGGAAQVLGFTVVYDATLATEQAFVSAQANVQAPTCKPAISSPPVTRTGLDYLVTWTTVSDPTAQYIVEESTTPDFSSGVTPVQVNGFSRTYKHDVTATTTYYYRVRPTTCANGGPQNSLTTSTIVQAPPPATSKNPEATVPLGTTQPVAIQVFLAGSGAIGPSPLADPTYTASTDKPYLSVSPASGTIPPAGTTVTVTALPGSLPAGANTGTLKVTTNGTTTTNTPISINLVTPVSPVERTTPPPTALVIPVVTHVNGATSPFLSDVRLTNASGTPVKYQLTMTRTEGDGSISSKATLVNVGTQETTALNDIVKNFFGFGATGAPTDVGFGSLEIRPIDSGSNLTFAASRTYASAAIGTFGQFIAAVPFSKFASKIIPLNIPGTNVGRLATKLSLQQVAQSSRFRTNFGLAEGSGQPASGIIRIFDAAGANLKEVPFSLQAGEQKQFNGFISANGVPTLTDGRIEVEITSPTGAVTAYASVLDNATTDPLAVSPVDVEDVSASRYVVPGVAELNNGASNFHSDVRLR